MTTVIVKYTGDLQTECLHQDSQSTLLTDAPKDNQGLGRHFSPTDLVGTSMASCMATIMGILAKKNNWNLSGMTIIVKKEMQSNPRRISRLTMDFEIPGTFKEDEKKKLINAAMTCPVKQSLHPDVEVVTNFNWK